MGRQNWKKCIGMMMTAALSLQLIGCGQAAGNTTAQKEYVYVPEYQKIELEESIDQVSVVGDTVYFTTGFYNEQSESYEQQLGTLKIGEKTPKLVTLELEEEARMNGMLVDTDGNMQTVVTTYIYEETNAEDDEAESDADEAESVSEEVADIEESMESEDVIETTESVVIASEGVVSTSTAVEWIGEESFQTPVTMKTEVRTYNTEGKIVAGVELTEAMEAEGEIYIQYLETDTAGNLYLGGEESVWVFDKNGKELCKLEVGNWLQNMFSTKDGQIMVVYYGDNGVEVHPVDVKARKIGDTMSELMIENYGNYTFAQSTNADFVFTVDNELYTYNYGEEAPTKLLNWIDCDMDTDQLQTFALLTDGRILAVTSTWNDEGKSEVELAYLTKKKGSEVPEKKILTLGTMSLDYDTRKQVIEYNKTNAQYRIEVKEYLTDVSIDGYEDALEKMSTDIVSGNCPDLIDLSNANMQRYIAKGVLADWYPFMEKDEEMNKEDYLENILRAYEVDGKLYTLPSRFYINTIIAKQSDFGDRQSITLEELMEKTKELPEDVELYEYATKSSILMWNTMMNMEQYVNWSTGECKFNNEEFIRALEFANQFEKEISFDEEQPSTSTKLREGKLLMMNSSISSVQEYQMYSAMFGEPIAFVGYPTTKENGSFISGGGSSLAISAKSPYQEGAWQFVRKELTKEEQEKGSDGAGYGFPIMKSALEKQFAKDMEEEYYEDVDGNKKKQPKTTWGYDDFSVEIYAATKEEVAVVRNLIDTVDTVYQYDEQIYQMISEESEAFFEGQKSAKEVADIIQSRVQIYVNENR